MKEQYFFNSLKTSDGTEYEFFIYGNNYEYPIPIDKSGIAIITKLDRCNNQYLRTIVTDRLSRYIDRKELEYDKTDELNYLLNSYNEKLPIKGDCILFCPIDKDCGELEDILKDIIEHNPKRFEFI